MKYIQSLDDLSDTKEYDNFCVIELQELQYI